MITITETRETKKEIPCGELITKEYLENGIVVRSDQTVNVSEEFLLGALAGKVTFGDIR